VKTALKGNKFEDVETMENVTSELNTVPLKAFAKTKKLNFVALVRKQTIQTE
jgi:hypothetical protein